MATAIRRRVGIPVQRYDVSVAEVRKACHRTPIDQFVVDWSDVRAMTWHHTLPKTYSSEVVVVTIGKEKEMAAPKPETPGPMTRAKFLALVQKLKAEGKTASVSEEERQEIDLAKEQMARGEFVSHAEIRRQAGLDP
jgi:hypothetical protein